MTALYSLIGGTPATGDQRTGARGAMARAAQLHVPPEQPSAEFAHVFPAQHAWPTPPHSWLHVPALHESPAAVQAEPEAQHACPWPPHWPHLPAPPPPHASPALHVVPPQQSCPMPPQRPQTPATPPPPHVAPAAVHVLPAQHGPPTSPHVASPQTPAAHARPSKQTLPRQQASPLPPHPHLALTPQVRPPAQTLPSSRRHHRATSS